MVGGTRATSGGSTLLVGNTTSTQFVEVNENSLYYTSFVASASGVPATIQIGVGAEIVANSIMAAIYDNAGTKIAETASTTMTYDALNTLTVLGGAGSITSGQTYHLAVMANGGWNVAVQNDSWISKAVGVTYPTLPASVNPGSDSYSSVGTIKIYAYS